VDLLMRMTSLHDRKRLALKSFVAKTAVLIVIAIVLGCYFIEGIISMLYEHDIDTIQLR
jgi:hypothetical protein